jgi:hypothetical protein
MACGTRVTPATKFRILMAAYRTWRTRQAALTRSAHCPVADRGQEFCGGLVEPGLTIGVLGVEVEMQLFTFSITDLTTFESVPHEEWAEKEDLFEIGNRFARAMLAANPDFRHRGMCVAIYDEAGMAVSMMPLDTLQ